MGLTLDRPVFAGNVAFAAIARTDVTRHRLGCLGSKRAMALLIRRDREIEAFTPAGRKMSAAEVEELCPGVLVRFARLTGDPLP